MEILKYQDRNIRFEPVNGSMMVNLTDMLKAYPNKVMGHFLRDPARLATVLIYCKRNSLKTSAIHTGMSLTMSQLSNLFPESIKVDRDNSSEKKGTSAIKPIALLFAHWLDPKFYVWTNDRIEELLEKGTVSIGNTVNTEVQQVVNAKRSEILKLALELQIEKEELEEENKALKPKAEYCEHILESVGVYSKAFIATELGLKNSRKLNTELERIGFQHYSHADEHWIVKQQYIDLGYCDSKTEPAQNYNGRWYTKVTVTFTESGRNWLHEVLPPAKKPVQQRMNFLSPSSQL